VSFPLLVIISILLEMVYQVLHYFYSMMLYWLLIAYVTFANWPYLLKEMFH